VVDLEIEEEYYQNGFFVRGVCPYLNNMAVRREMGMKVWPQILNSISDTKTAEEHPLCLDYSFSSCLDKLFGRMSV
jgi:hypothetical protein